MKNPLLCLLAVLSCASGLSSAQPLEEAKPAPGNLPGWGAATDPDGDCRFYLAKRSLLIHVPGSATPHDLAAEIGTVNAPRVLRKVTGDFTIQVKVEGRYNPGGESTKEGRTGYNGAGIIAMTDTNHVITLARAVLQHEGGEPRPYANFEMRTGGELQRMGITSDCPIPLKEPVYLRLERRGAKVSGAVSVDGITWQTMESKEIPDWPAELQIGVAAISTSREEFNPRFSELQVLK